VAAEQPMRRQPNSDSLALAMAARNPRLDGVGSCSVLPHSSPSRCCRVSSCALFHPHRPDGTTIDQRRFARSGRPLYFWLHRVRRGVRALNAVMKSVQDDAARYAAMACR